MTEFVFSPPPSPSIAVHESEQRFPVRRIFCVGRNYAAHAREMGKDPDREPPFFFTKPADALVDDNAEVPYPPQTQKLHHEAELVVAIGVSGSNIAEDDALDHVWGYAVGNELHGGATCSWRRANWGAPGTGVRRLTTRRFAAPSTPSPKWGIPTPARLRWRSMAKCANAAISAN